MDKFKEIKSILNNQDVVQKYLGLPVKHNSVGNWYKSPFREEKTASFCVSDKGIHDFGDSKHYDIISFVAKYFCTTQFQALKILCNEFNIGTLENEYETREIVKMLRQKKEEERLIRVKIEQWYNSEWQEVCDLLRVNQECIEIFEKTAYFETLKALYDENVKLEFYAEILFYADMRLKEKIYFWGISK